MSIQTNPVTDAPANPVIKVHVAVTHALRRAPNTYLCTCGQPRESCVRDSVRELWAG